MAEIFEEIQTGYELVTNLLSVGNAVGLMRTGDLIAVNNAATSVAFHTGSSNQILVTDSSTATHLNWKGANRLIGFTTSGQILTSGPTGSLVIVNQGTNGQILTVNASHIPTWTNPGSAVNTPTSGAISFDVYPGQIQNRPANGRDFTFFSWRNAEYGTSASATFSNMGLTAGNLVFYADATGATINANLFAGTGVARLFPAYTVQSGMNQVNISSPTADSLYRFSSSGSVGVNMYAFQMHFKTTKIPVAI